MLIGLLVVYFMVGPGKVTLRTLDSPKKGIGSHRGLTLAAWWLVSGSNEPEGL
jgi:hypothetical protein